MKTALAVLMGAALVALFVMSIAPQALVGIREGFGSLAGLATAGAIVLITGIGGWIWWSDRRRKDD